MLSRRAFFSALGAAAGVAACGRNGAAMQSAAAGASTRRRLDRIGIQLYTVRREMERDLPRTFARLAEIGYREVEFAGYFDRTPAQIRAQLDLQSLTAPSAHFEIDTLRRRWDSTLDAAAEIGHKFVTINWLPAETRRTLDDWRRIADDFNAAGEKAKSRGIKVGYHNYDVSLRPIDGVVPLDLLLARTSPEVVSFQMDVYWLVHSGGDPLAYVRKYPNRFSMLHVKDSAGPPSHPQTDVGAGVIDFRALLALDARQQGAIRHVFVEHDEPPDPMAFAKKAFDYLRALEF